MQLTELRLENYGGGASRELVIPENAGLTVVFGANETGKSTCLEAISDFLFSIPKNTQRGGLFGYDGMRIGASMRLADGTVLSLKRRKGNGRTLADSAGTALDDTALAPVLGAITRDRFETLFGLNHETLRNGGERLLHADGDIGRLIVEAGGGLRTLVSRLESIDAEADKLFDTRRSASRVFYQQLSVFETAEKTARGAQLSRETYETTRKAALAAGEKLKALRDERRSLGTSTAKLERVLRVAPHLRELDRLAEALPDDEDERSQAVNVFDSAIMSSDALADRRAQEAERAATLAQALRRLVDATAEATTAESEATALSRQMEVRSVAWSTSFPDAHGRHPEPAALLTFSQTRQQLLDESASLRYQSNALAVDAAQLSPTAELLERIEHQRALDPSLSFAARVSALQSAISRHEQAHADFFRDGRDREDIAQQHKIAEAYLRQLTEAQASWEAAWPPLSASCKLHRERRIEPRR